MRDKTPTIKLDDKTRPASLPPKNATPGKTPLNICIASPEFIGLSRQCTTGFAYTALAQALAAAGHRVTCLFLGSKDPASHPWAEWVEKYRRDGLTLIALPQINASELVAPRHLIQSYETYHWLKRNDRFDIIHFPDRHGPGYHTLTAKHHGLAFARTTICVDLHSMSAWLKAVGTEQAQDSSEVDTAFMERRTVALADAVVSPSHYLLDWISEQQWEMPRHCYVRQNFPGPSARKAKSPGPLPLHEIKELVYFGALESRMGAAIFCDALDAIPSAIAKKIQKVTFLGRESIVDGIPARTYLEKRAQEWPFPMHIITGSDANETVEYLRQKNRLAVIPPLVETSPYRVLECLVAGIPFVTSRVAGIPELIEPDDVGKVCFEPNTSALCAVLCVSVADGMRPARAAVDSSVNEQSWIALHENSFARRNPVPPTSAALAAAATNEAERTAIQALSIDPRNSVALKVLARIHLNAGLFEAAQEACQLILKRNAKDAEALQMMEEATARAGRPSEPKNLAKGSPALPNPLAAETFAVNLSAQFAS
jgi:O-antigen biosynthesis protein